MTEAAEPEPLPAIPRSRQRSALLRKDYAVAAGRGGFAVVQSLFLLYLAIVFFAWLGSAAGGPGWTFEDSGRELVLIIAYFANLGALFLGPILGAGAFQEERERGMIEILSAVPVHRRDIFSSIVGVRLLLIGQFFLAATPLFAIPIAAGAAVPIGIPLRALAIACLGASVTTLFAMGLFARGQSTVIVYGRILLLIILTPLAIGLRGRWIILFGVGGPILLGLAFWGLDSLALLPSLLTALLQPFSGMALAIEHGWMTFPSITIASTAVVVLLGIRFAWVARSEVDRWWQRERGGARLEVRRRRRTAFRRDGEVLGVVETDSGAGKELRTAPLLATTRIASPPLLTRFVYRGSGRNALVARFISERSYPLLAPLCALAIAAIIHFPGLRGTPSRTIAADWTALTLLGVAALVAISGGRWLPARRRGRSADALLSSPLRGRHIAIGALGIGFLETWPLLIALLLGQVWYAAGTGRIAVAGAHLLLALGFCLLAVGITAGCAVLAPRAGARVGSALTAIALLVLPTFILGKNSLPAELSPFRVWVAGNENRDALELLGGAFANGGAGLALLGLLALFFDRLSRRA